MPRHLPHIVLVPVLLLLAAGTGLNATEVPVLPTYVTDFAGLLTASEKSDLENSLRTYEEQTSNQFVVLIIKTLEGESIEDYSLAVVEKNLVGQKGNDNGLLFLIAVNDRKMRFEVGYGLEPVLTDALASIIIRDIVSPEFRSGRFSNGIGAGLSACMKAVAGEFVASETDSGEYEEESGWGDLGYIIFMIVLFIILSRGRGGRGGGLLWILGSGGFGGGGFGGGGGGGFGGFSGGGGSFGGGGASGSW